LLPTSSLTQAAASRVYVADPTGLATGHHCAFWALAG